MFKSGADSGNIEKSEQRQLCDYLWENGTEI